MTGAARASWGLVVLGLLASAAMAAEATKVAWHNNVDEAWKATQKEGRPMLVFVTRADCLYCTKMKDGTLRNATVAGTINQSYVAVVLDGGKSSPLLKELNVTAYPSTFIISPDAVILDRIDGYVTPDAMANRLRAKRAPASMAKAPATK